MDNKTALKAYNYLQNQSQANREKILNNASTIPIANQGYTGSAQTSSIDSNNNLTLNNADGSTTKVTPDDSSPIKAVTTRELNDKMPRQGQLMYNIADTVNRAVNESKTNGSSINFSQNAPTNPSYAIGSALSAANDKVTESANRAVEKVSNNADAAQKIDNLNAELDAIYENATNARQTVGHNGQYSNLARYVNLDKDDRARVKEIRRERDSLNDQIGLTLGERTASFAKSVANNIGGSFEWLGETIKQMASDIKDTNANIKADQKAYNDQTAGIKSQIISLEEEMKSIDDTDELNNAIQKLSALNDELAKVDDKYKTTTVASSEKGDKLLNEASRYMYASEAGTTTEARRVMNTAYSVAPSLVYQGAALAATVVTGGVAAPYAEAISLGLMGMSSAGSKMKELSDRDISSIEAATRGIISGSIEIATEKMGFDQWMDFAKSPVGKNFITSYISNIVPEAAEEGASYVLNYLADVFANDPEAKFSIEELGQAIGGGAAAGALLGGGTALLSAGVALADGTSGTLDSLASKVGDYNSFAEFEADNASELAKVGLVGENKGTNLAQQFYEENGGKTQTASGTNDDEYFNHQYDVEQYYANELDALNQRNEDRANAEAEAKATNDARADLASSLQRILNNRNEQLQPERAAIEAEQRAINAESRDMSNADRTALDIDNANTLDDIKSIEEYIMYAFDIYSEEASELMKRAEDRSRAIQGIMTEEDYETRYHPLSSTEQQLQQASRERALERRKAELDNAKVVDDTYGLRGEALTAARNIAKATDSDAINDIIETASINDNVSAEDLDKLYEIAIGKMDEIDGTESTESETKPAENTEDVEKLKEDYNRRVEAEDKVIESMPKDKQDTIAFIKDNSSKITKSNVVVTDEISQNGWYDGETDTIYISSNSTDPLFDVYKHEIVHTLKKNKATWRRIKNYVIGRVKAEAKSVGKTINDVREKAKTAYPKADPGEIDEEIVASWLAENVYTSPNAINDFVKYNSSAAYRMWYKFKSWLKSLTMGKEEREANRKIALAEQYFAEAIRGARDKESVGGKGMASVGFSVNEAINALANGDEDALNNVTPAERTKTRKSNFITNTTKYNKTIDPALKEIARLSTEDGTYDVVSENESLINASNAVSNDYQGTMKKNLENSNMPSGQQCDEMMIMLHEEGIKARNTGDYSTYEALVNKLRKYATSAGQFIQAFAKWSRDDANALRKWANTPARELVNFQVYLDSLTKAWENKNARRVREVNEAVDAALESGYKNVNELADALESELEKWGVDEELCMQIAEKAIDADLGYSNDDIRSLAHCAIANKFIGLNTDEMNDVMDLLNQAYEEGEFTKERVELVNEACTIFTDHLPPPTLWEMFNTFRYDAMLGNFGTHIRNMLGNGIFGKIAVGTKNIIATGVESIYDSVYFAKTGEHIEKTKSIKYDREIRSACKTDADSIEYLLRGGDKYGVRRGIEATRRAYGNNEVMNAIHKFIGDKLEWEDYLALKSAYTDALSGWLIAHDLDESIFDSEEAEDIATLFRGRSYAIAQAQQATFRNANAVAQAINSMKRSLQNSSSKGARAAGMLIEGAIPFTNTPANILARGVEYSPVGLLSGISKVISSVTTENETPAEACDKLAAGLTGTGVMLLGLLMGSMGLLTGGEPDDDREKAEAQAEGWQAYSFHVGDVYYSFDWAAPIALPLFVGVEIANSRKNDETWINDVATATGNILEPMTEMSMLQGINNMISSVQYSDNKVAGIATSAATSYFTQAVPTILGQAARTVDPIRRTNVSQKSGAEKSIEYTTNKIKSKIPGLSQTLEPYVNIWGEEEYNTSENALVRGLMNFFSPGYLSLENKDDVEEYITNLYNETGDHTVIPTQYKSSTSIKFDGDKTTLTAEQKTEYNKIRGQESKSIVDDLIANRTFTTLSDSSQINIITSAYIYAGEMAKMGIKADWGKDANDSYGWVNEAYDGTKKGISVDTYLVLKYAVNGISSDKDKDGKTVYLSKSNKVKEEIDKLTKGYSKSQREYLYGCFGVSEKVW